MKNRILILFLIVIIITGGCTEFIDFELNDEGYNRLVVDGLITTDTCRHVVRLSQTLSYYANEKSPPETEADVTISDGINIFPLTETEPGIYQTEPDVYGQVGKTYTLDIVLSNEKNYSASCLLKAVPLIDSVVPSPNYFNIFYDSYGYDLFFFGQEPQGKGDYYLWDIYINDVLYNDTLRKTRFVDDQLVDGQYIHDFDIYFIEESQFTSDTSKIRVDMLSIHKEYFNYMLFVMLETDWRGGMYDGPPANVPTNTTNGALGFFNASAISSYEFLLIKEK